MRCEIISMPGPASKPENLRQRRNKKASAAELTAPETPEIPAIPNPDKREWHELSIAWWDHIWSSPMATRYLKTDLDGLGMLALIVDEFYKTLDLKLLAEIRMQESRYGLSPWDRARLDWRVTPAADDKPKPVSRKRDEAVDPRKFLKAVK